ncbi:transglutaminase family protein [Synechococcus sp. Cruz-9H2]|uniref:transglutaminase family protein n=1 Tax=unclassified Synechococcus TaxID=2626047 RepID=UPI0020CCD873|nr:MULTISPECIES: transglutaminase family protein [unclassified Synechococcus]MCP9820184.1 transglutaminase family protein [Synechococcus sp. Cruz-9H2]MCP9844576.1 transglutaminase family protein [Synechococcus sp. Edmonson 11F2]MCP9856614.1 transglutaminase family protein [Synechococcus sp. Cruz-9C9]MCP9863899.1 transglutaminase family protein [Synechococcus sp. Cruz-7E5]MCP9871179.1 transglutaminase family protein [Synechococcus sp. Cruz-7B9]
MKKIRITHETIYHYKQPVTFGEHMALMRPREGHDVHIERGLVEIEPKASVRWVRDLYANSVAKIAFAKPSNKLRIFSEVDVVLYDEKLVRCHVDPEAISFPFHYSPDEQLGLVPYRLPSFSQDGLALKNWMFDLHQPGQAVDTLELLNKLNTRIYEAFQYTRREDPGVQLPSDTIALGSGSCRDYAVLMMEAARYWGLAAQFVTGYVQMGEGQHGSTHAWTEIYIPGVGWQGFDPTNNKLAGDEHISAGVAPHHAQASPLSGSWAGPIDAFKNMEVSVQVVALDQAPDHNRTVKV